MIFCFKSSCRYQTEALFKAKGSSQGQVEVQIVSSWAVHSHHEREEACSEESVFVSETGSCCGRGMQ